VLIVLVVLLVLAVVYFVFSGGFSSLVGSDIPEYAAPTPEGTIAPTAEPPAAAPGGGTGATAPAAPSIGGATTAPEGAGVAAAPGAAPAAAKEKLTSEEKLEKLEAFRKIDSREILARRIEEAREGETVVNAEEGLPYPEVGRTDPLFIVSDAIPKELRPPRTGESDTDKVFEELIRQAIETAILDSVRIEVWSVMRIGLTTMVNLSVDGRLGTLPVGYPLDMGYYSLTITSASQRLVTIVLQSGDISKTRSFVPRD